MSLKSFLAKIQEELRKKDEVRGEVQEDMRRATRLSKQAILFVHQGRFGDAEKLLKDAEELLAKLRSVSRDHPDLIYSGLVDAAFEEYAEACTLVKLVKESQFISHEELGVPAVSYVLGLGDVVGELRRRALDSLRKGDVKTAEECLQMMEQIYVELTAMDNAYMLAPGLRRKCDVARHVIEATRGDVTIEARRSSLEHSIERLEKNLRRKKKVGKTGA
jgi:translin